jgi:hypothetical protein
MRRCLATAIEFDLRAVATSLAVVKITATGESFLPEPVPGGTAVQGILAAKVEIPPMLIGTSDQLHVLGDPAGPIVLRLRAILRVYNEALERQANLCITQPEIRRSVGERFSVSSVTSNQRLMKHSARSHRYRMAGNEPLQRSSDDTRQRRRSPCAADRLVPRLPPSGRARPRRHGRALWCRDDGPGLALAAGLRPMRQQAGRFRRHRGAALIHCPGEKERRVAPIRGREE